MDAPRYALTLAEKEHVRSLHAQRADAEQRYQKALADSRQAQADIHTTGGAIQGVAQLLAKQAGLAGNLSFANDFTELRAERKEDHDGSLGPQ